MVHTHIKVSQSALYEDSYVPESRVGGHSSQLWAVNSQQCTLSHVIRGKAT